MRKTAEEDERAERNEEGVADKSTDQTEAARRGEPSRERQMDADRVPRG